MAGRLFWKLFSLLHLRLKLHFFNSFLRIFSGRNWASELLVPEESDIMTKLSWSFFMAYWTDESPFCFKAYFPFLDSHPDLLMHLCPLGQCTRTHYSICGNGNFRCGAALTSYMIAACAWMLKQGTGTSLLPIKSLWNSWFTACHCGLQVQQGFTIPDALCQNKSTTLLGQGKGSGCVLLWQGPSGWLGSTLSVSMGCAAILNPCDFFPPALSNPFWTHLFLVGWFWQAGGSALAW